MEQGSVTAHEILPIASVNCKSQELELQLDGKTGHAPGVRDASTIASCKEDTHVLLDKVRV